MLDIDDDEDDVRDELATIGAVVKGKLMVVAAVLIVAAPIELAG